MSCTKPEVHNISQLRCRRRTEPSNGHRQHAQKLLKIARAVPEISSQTDRHTDTHTDIRIAILAHTLLERSNRTSLHMNRKTNEACNFSCLIETKGLLKVTGSHAHCA